MALRQLTCHLDRETELDDYFMPYTNANSRWIEDLSIMIKP